MKTHGNRSAWPPYVSVLSVMVALIGGGCQGDAAIERDSIPGDNREATLTLDLAIGDDASASAEYQFASIRYILGTPEGTMWVVDGRAALSGGTPLIRRYDSQGHYLNQVGGAGGGPGEYQEPLALALMPDGLAALRDAGLRERITFYTSRGVVDTTWLLAQPLRLGRVPAIAVDDAGHIWLSTVVLPSPDPTTTYLLLKGGSIVDSVKLPALPEPDADRMRYTRTLASGRKDEVENPVPYGPRGTATWLPSGSFAIARTDEYRIEILPPYGAPPTAESRFISRNVSPVPVPEAERAELHEEMVARVEAAGDRRAVHIPEVPRYKPPIRYLSTSADGQLLVFVSMPSRFQEGEWTEPQAFDVFAPDGRFKGRIVLPDSLGFAYMRGNLIWGVWRGEYDMESIRRYRIIWP